MPAAGTRTGGQADRFGDRLRVSLTVTEAGYQLLDKLALGQRLVHDIEFDCLSGGEFAELVEILDRRIDSFNRALSLKHGLISYYESEQTG